MPSHPFWLRLWHTFSAIVLRVLIPRRMRRLIVLGNLSWVYIPSSRANPALIRRINTALHLATFDTAIEGVFPFRKIVCKNCLSGEEVELHDHDPDQLLMVSKVLAGRIPAWLKYQSVDTMAADISALIAHRYFCQTV